MIGASGKSNAQGLQPNYLNKSGAALVLGGCYELDVLRANAASVDTETSMDNMIIPTTAGIAAGVPYSICLSDKLDADGNRAAFQQVGPVLALVTGTIAIGDKLIPANASTALVKNTGTGPGLAVAMALETNAGGPNLRQVLMAGEFARMNQGTT